MKAVLAFFFIISLAFLGCAGSQTARQSAIEQGISGYILQEKGNRMPSPDKPASTPQGLKTMVFIHSVTEVTQLTKLATPGLYQSVNTPAVASATTDSTGYFSVSLPPGTYSIFVKYGEGFYANWFNEKNQVSPVEVLEQKVTKVKLIVSAGASY
jgi:hypothetical protein